MIMKKLILFAFVATILFGSCTRTQEPFSFTLRSDSIKQGESLKVSLQLTSGPHDGYQVLSNVEEYELTSSTGKKTPYTLMCSGGAADGPNVNFEDAGRKDYHVDGLPAGTYRVVVALTRDGVTKTSSVVAVVYEPTIVGPSKDVDVSAFEVSGLQLGEGGVLKLSRGETKRYPLEWTPENANKLAFEVNSSDNAVVEASLDGFDVVLKAVGAGVATVSVRSESGVEVSVPVVVVDVPVVVPVGSIEIVGLTLDSNKRLVLEDNSSVDYVLNVKPEGASADGLVVTSSDASVASGRVENGKLFVDALYPGNATITVSSPDSGVSTSFVVRVFKNVKVTIEWVELNATEAQINTKTFPCYLRFSSDSDKRFPTPVTWSVTMKGVVNSPGRDTQSVTSKQNVNFYGNQVAQYDVTTNVLIPCYSIYRTTNFTLSLTLALQRSDSLDPDLWKLSYDNKFLGQDVRVNQYLTDIQQ